MPLDTMLWGPVDVEREARIHFRTCKPKRLLCTGPSLSHDEKMDKVLLAASGALGRSPLREWNILKGYKML